MKYNFTSILSTLALIVLTTSPSFASSTTVTSAGNNGAGSLRAALIDSTTADTVFFDPSVVTITLSSQISINRDVVIIGNGINETILSGGNSTRLLASNFKIYIRSMTVSNGKASEVGGAFSFGGQLATIEDVEFRDNEGRRHGGAILMDGDTLNLVNVVLRNNKTTSTFDSRGGALYVRKGKVFMKKCQVVNNQTNQFAGGIYNDDGVIYMDSCTVHGNMTDAPSGTSEGGGGIYNSGTMYISDSEISGNTTDWTSAGIRKYRYAEH